MRASKFSTMYILIIMSVISLAIIGSMLSCGDDKQITPLVAGPAAGSGPVGGGDTQKIRLLASPSETITVATGEQATAKITALVENNIGQPMPDGTVVYWSATIGDLDSTTTTTSNGSSTVTLTFPESYDGCSEVTARSGDAEATVKICVTSVNRIFIVNATNTTIYFTTSSPKQTQITALATTNGEPDVNLQVSFSVSGPGVLSASASVTDSSGQATVTLTATDPGSDPQTATVTATTADGRSGTISVMVYN